MSRTVEQPMAADVYEDHGGTVEYLAFATGALKTISGIILVFVGAMSSSVGHAITDDWERRQFGGSR